MVKPIHRFRYYRFVCKLAGRSASWFKWLGKYIRAPREQMHFVMIPIEKSIEAPKQQLLPMDIVGLLVDKAAAAAVANHCMCRVGGSCRDYPQDIGCLMLGKAVEALDLRIGRAVSKEEARAHIQRALDNGLYPLISHYIRDAMMFGLDFDHLAIVCFCCPCHCVARNAGKASEGLKNSFYENCEKFPTVQVSFDASKCRGCGKCARECFANAIRFEQGKICFDAQKCKGCGHCAYICGAYSVSYDACDAEAILSQLSFTQGVL